MNEVIAFMGKQIERKLLFSQTYIIALLKEEGANYTTLANLRGWYIKQYGDELCISYPFVQGSHNGILILPVQEGFLRLPFDEVDEFTFEQFDLYSASLLSAAEVADMEKNLKNYTESLFASLADIHKALSPETEDTLNALGYTGSDLESDPSLMRGLTKACAYIQETEG